MGFEEQASASAKLTSEMQLASFINKYSPEIAALAKAILHIMKGRCPTAVQLVYDNYNALAIGFGPGERASEAIFSIALYPKWVSLFFLQAAGLHDPEHLLQGKGKVAKHIVLDSAEALERPAVRSLMQQALTLASVPLPPDGSYKLVIKSASAKQRARRPAG